MKPALIVIDMLNDFVYGALASPGSREIVPNIKRLIAKARSLRIPVVYVCDAHYKDVDWELKLWGPHALAGTRGAEVIDELKPEQGDFLVRKRRYSGFFQTDLGILLRELGADTLILTGIDTSICVSHTAADAFYRGYALIVPRDAVATFDPKDNEQAISYLKKVYGAEITTTDELILKLERKLR
ncbi:MAG: cysteine hydrolase [Candidatus Methanomethyliales bacterium]|nr:cysteine hydrolase [Candidatus Methanomethylicales archaeon]